MSILVYQIKKRLKNLFIIYEDDLRISKSGNKYLRCLEIKKSKYFD